MSLTNESRNLLVNLRQTRKAILGRGGTLTATAGMKDFPNAIFNIPADASLAYYTDDTSALKKTVPNGAEDYAQLKSVGGMTRVEYSPNLLKGAGEKGWKYGGENGYDTSFYIVGIDGGRFRFDIINKPAHCTCNIIYCHQDDTLGSYEIGEVIDAPSLETHAGYFIYITFHGLEMGEVIYPMFYRLPDNNEEYRITEYIPYGAQKLVPTAVTEIVSKGVSEDALDTIAIPDAVKNDASWGHGLRSAQGNITTQRDFHNTYDFNAKQYIKWLSDKIIADGVNVKAVGLLSTAGGMQIALNTTNAKYADYTAFKITRFTPALSKEKNTAYLVANNTQLILNLFTDTTFASVDEANVWLAENPIEVEYAFAEPIVIPIDDAVAPKFIKVEGGGTLEFENEAKADVPSNIKYVQKVGT